MLLLQHIILICTFLLLWDCNNNILAVISLFKVNNANTTARCEICLKLKVKKLIVNFEDISHFALVFLVFWNILDQNILLWFVKDRDAVLLPRDYSNNILAGISLFKVNNANTRTRCEICSKLTIKTLLTLKMFHTLF